MAIPLFIHPASNHSFTKCLLCATDSPGSGNTWNECVFALDVLGPQQRLLFAPGEASLHEFRKYLLHTCLSPKLYYFQCSETFVEEFPDSKIKTPPSDLSGLWVSEQT